MDIFSASLEKYILTIFFEVSGKHDWLYIILEPT